MKLLHTLRNTGAGVLTIVTERRFHERLPGKVYRWREQRDKPMCWWNGPASGLRAGGLSRCYQVASK